MDSTSIELPNSEIESIRLQDGCLRVRFSQAILIKTMTGSSERTRWWQAGDLVVFTYRDMIPLPLSSRGHAGCDLGFRNTDARLRASANAIRLEMVDVAKYIEHIRSD